MSVVVMAEVPHFANCVVTKYGFGETNPKQTFMSSKQKYFAIGSTIVFRSIQLTQLTNF